MTILVLRRGVLVLAVAVQMIALYLPRAAGPQSDLPLDKVAHVLVFAMVALAACWARVPLRWTVGLLVAQAVISELVQEWVLPERSGDLADLVADLVGITVGVLAARALHLLPVRRASDVAEPATPPS